MSLTNKMAKCSSCICEKYEICKRRFGREPEVDYYKHICNEEGQTKFKYFAKIDSEIEIKKDEELK